MRCAFCKRSATWLLKYQRKGPRNHPSIYTKYACDDHKPTALSLVTLRGTTWGSERLGPDRGNE